MIFLQAISLVLLNGLSGFAVFAFLAYTHWRWLRKDRRKHPARKFSIPLIAGSLIVPVFGMIAIIMSGIRATKWHNAAAGLENKFSETTLGMVLVLFTPVIMVVYWFFMRKADTRLKKRYRQKKANQIAMLNPKTHLAREPEVAEKTDEKEIQSENEVLQSEPVAVSVGYQYRKSLFEGERTYEIVDNGMTISEGSQILQFIPFADIRKVRLYYKPGRFKHFNYACEIDYKGGMYALYSSHYVKPGDFKNRNIQYSLFIKSFIKEVNEKNPSAQLLAGHSRARYFLYLTITAGSILLIAFSLFFFPVIMGGFLFILRILFIAWLSYYTVIMLKKNVPKKIVDGMVPGGVVPRQA